MWKCFSGKSAKRKKKRKEKERAKCNVQVGKDGEVMGVHMSEYDKGGWVNQW